MGPASSNGLDGSCACGIRITKSTQARVGCAVLNRLLMIAKPVSYPRKKVLKPNGKGTNFATSIFRYLRLF